MTGEDCFRRNIAQMPPMRDDGLAQFEESIRDFAGKFMPDVPIDASTARCKWLGERMDYSTAIEGMQTSENGCWVNGRPVLAGTS